MMLPPAALRVAAAPQAPTLAALMDRLAPELRAIVIRGLTPTAARTLASTGSAALQAVLDARTDVACFTLHRALARSMVRLRFSPSRRGTAAACCIHMGVKVLVTFALHAAPLICVEQQHAGPPADPALFWLLPAVICSATRVETQRIDSLNSNLSWPFFLPSGMRALPAAILSSGLDLQRPHSLPLSSCGSLRTLRVSEAKLHSMPAGMGNLVVLQVTGSTCLQPGWLPESSCASIQQLDISGSDARSLPARMQSLRHLDVSGCKCLEGNWLPESSAQRVRVLTATGSSILRVPEHLCSLEALRITGCHALDGLDWLPASSRQRLRIVAADSSCINSLPSGLGTLEAVAVTFCYHLHLDADGTWMPVDCRGSVHTLLAQYTGLGSVPERMGALQTVSVAGCRRLAAEWLPDSSKQRVTTLSAENSNIERMPAGMVSLAALDVRNCKLLPGWMPASSATRLSALAADTSSMQRLSGNNRWLRGRMVSHQVIRDGSDAAQYAPSFHFIC